MSEAPELEPTDAPKADVTTPAAETPQAGDPKAQIERAAKLSGWSAKDEWNGDPAEWIDAPDFILKAAGEVLPSMRQSLQEAREEVKTLKKAVKTSIEHMSKADARAYERAVADIQARQDQAAAMGDVEGVRAATAELVEKTKEATAPAAETPEPAPEFAAWQAENPWFGKDKPLTAATIEIANEVLAEGFTGKAQIKEVDKRVREAFPSKFTNPNRDRAAPVEGGSIVSRKPSKGYSDMPADARAMCDDLMKDIPSLTREKYAKQYFSDEVTK